MAGLGWAGLHCTARRCKEQTWSGFRGLGVGLAAGSKVDGADRTG